MHEILIFPCTILKSNDNPINFGEFIEMIFKYEELIQSEKTVCCHNFKRTKYRPIYLFYIYFLHLLPAFIIDTIALLQMYRKIQKNIGSTCLFSYGPMQLYE
ncbi:fatty acyl-CoA reductase wat-like isoform X1 [Vespula squamosa]|uniref:Fatty acyl-CoA reductase wat-like isoform X1 n=1 Tax=Vespula squamosa TaxID=30214 RepID=A0ABD2BGD1_VESSQ